MQALKWEVTNLAARNEKIQAELASERAINSGLRLEIGLLHKKLDRFRFSLPIKPQTIPSTDLSTEKTIPTINHILEVVGFNEKIGVIEILSGRKDEETNRARRFVYYLAKSWL